MVSMNEISFGMDRLSIACRCLDYFCGLYFVANCSNGFDKLEMLKGELQ